MASCIVLAGGLSSRFPQEKLAYRIMGGKTLIELVVDRIHHTGSCFEVLVSSSIHTRHSLKRLLKGYNVRIVVDEAYLPCSGPMRGIATGALYATSRELIVAPGDAAWLSPELVEALVEYSHEFKAQVTTPLWGDGFMPMLFIHIRDVDGVNPVEICISRGNISRPSDLFRAAGKLALIGTGLLGDDGLSFATLNTIKDLVDPRPRKPSFEAYLLEHHSSEFRRAQTLESLSIYDMALEAYLREYSIYYSNRIKHLAIHSLQDACRVAHLSGDLTSVSKISQTLEDMGAGKRHGRMKC